jgi:ABC-type transport system substrate-binding protein
VTRPLRTLGLLVACALVLAGCGASPYASQPEEGTLHERLVAEMKGFDPTQVDEEISHACVINVYDQLYEHHNLKRPYELQPCLAAAMPEISADGLTYTIRLKKGVKYADDPCFPGGKGRELVASDCVFCWKRLMDGHVNSPGTWLIEGRVVGLDDFHEASLKAEKRLDRGAYGKDRDEHGAPFEYPEVAGLAAPDSHTFVITLTKPSLELVWILAMPYFSVYPPEAIARYGRAFPEHPVSSGPYLVEEYDRAQRMVLVRNPNYREDYYPTEGAPGDATNGMLANAGKRLPLNDRVVVTVFKEPTPAWLYFESGYLDRIVLPKDNFDAAVDVATWQLRPRLKARGVVWDRDPKQEIIYDDFNFKDPIVGAGAGYRGRALRRAMSLGVDREWTARNLYNNRVSRVDGPIIRAYPEFDPSFVNPWVRGKDETMEQARERARTILADAGMPGGRGVPAIYVDVGDGSLEDQLFVAFKEDMARIGLNVQPYKVTWQEQMRRRREASFTMTGQAWGADYPAAQNFLSLFYGPNKAPGNNSSNYENPEYDALFAKAELLPPGPERTELYRKMQRIVVDDCVWIFRYAREQWTLRHSWLEGYRYNDIVLKSFKYCRIKTPERPQRIAAWNPVRWTPSLIALGVVVALVAATLVAARRQVKGW